MTVSELVQSLSQHCQQNVEERHVLAISDSSEINWQSHLGRLKSEGLGVVGNNTDVGFYIHPTLIVDSQSGFPLGLSTIQLWSRDFDHQDKYERNYQQLPIEQKESYKWLASAERSQRCLKAGGAKMVTHIGDRESDLYEEWATVPDGYNHLLVRVRQDRRLFDQEESLYSYLRKQLCEGTYTINVPADQRIERVSREALLTVRFAPVKIQRPKALKAFDYPQFVTLYAVEVEEVCPPAGQEPIHWRLLTTHDVMSIEQALQVIEWYKWRWRIEQLFATLKKAGLNLEGPPGMPTLVHGLRRFESIFLGWKLSQN